VSEQDSRPDEDTWTCAKCDVPLEASKVTVAYMGNMFPVDLLRCPKCGQTLVSENLATGRMAELEKTLEDK
jgi:hypothetical protein